MVACLQYNLQPGLSLYRPIIVASSHCLAVTISPDLSRRIIDHSGSNSFRLTAQIVTCVPVHANKDTLAWNFCDVDAPRYADICSAGISYARTLRSWISELSDGAVIF